MEPCQRCGCIGYDRRTLFMACFAEMDAYNIPFLRVRLSNAEFLSDTDVLRTDLEPFQKQPPPDFKPASGKLHDHDFYTLRVCKECRGEWLTAIEKWFHSRKAD